MKSFGPLFEEDSRTLILVETMQKRCIVYNERPIYSIPHLLDPRVKVETFSPTYERQGQHGGREQLPAEPTGRLMIDVADEDALQVAEMLAALR